jgi:hypothetical protein
VDGKTNGKAGVGEWGYLPPDLALGFGVGLVSGPIWMAARS